MRTGHAVLSGGGARAESGGAPCQPQFPFPILVRCDSSSKSHRPCPLRVFAPCPRSFARRRSTGSISARREGRFADLLHVVPTARVEIPSSRRMDAAARCWSTEVTADIARAASLTSMDLMGLNLSASGPFSFPSCSFGDLAGVAPLRAAALARRPRCHLMRSHSPPLV